MNSAEYTEQCIEADVVKDMGAKLVLVPRQKDFASTSDVVEIIKERYC